ncbi:MAG: hypothetical protein PVH48_07635 [Cyclobacteriaceae bacterium]|jgi:hypothetical protein
MKRLYLHYIIFLLLLFSGKSMAQWPLLPSGKELNPSDITQPYSDIAFSGELIDMIEGHIWQWTFQGGVAFGQNKHGLSLKVPFVRSVALGVEQLTGIGDINIRYHLVTYDSKLRMRTLASSALYLDLSIPTGNTLYGHGAGVPILTPGFTLAYRPVPQIAIYPHIRYLHSFGEAEYYWAGGNSSSDNVNVRTLQFETIFNYEFNEAWIGISPVVDYSFTSKEGTLGIRPQLGKLFAEKVSISLSGTFYVAGRRRLNSWTYFDVRYFF